MHRIKFKYGKDEPEVLKEKPNWNIQALYYDRQLVNKGKKTKYFIPYDSADPEDVPFILQISSDDKEDIKTYELSKSETLIGRDSMCDIQFKQKIISGQHCVIQFRKVTLHQDSPIPEVIPYIFDMGSKNGTFIDGKRIPSKQFVQLLDDDKITFDGNGKSGIIIGVYQRNSSS